MLCWFPFLQLLLLRTRVAYLRRSCGSGNQILIWADFDKVSRHLDLVIGGRINFSYSTCLLGDEAEWSQVS